MDRFIEFSSRATEPASWDLKSSMDRFIAVINVLAITLNFNLKSSMDRFIDNHFIINSVSPIEFKIQYG